MNWLFQMFLFGLLSPSSQLDADDDINRIRYHFNFLCPDRHVKITCVLKQDEALLSDIKTKDGYDIVKQVMTSYPLDPNFWGEKIVRPYIDIVHNCGPNGTDALQRQQYVLQDCVLAQGCGFTTDLDLE